MSEFTTELTCLPEDRLHNCDATIDNGINTCKDDSKGADVCEVSRAEVYANQVIRMVTYHIAVFCG